METSWKLKQLQTTVRFKTNPGSCPVLGARPHIHQSSIYLWVCRNQKSCMTACPWDHTRYTTFPGQRQNFWAGRGPKRVESKHCFRRFSFKSTLKPESIWVISLLLADNTVQTQRLCPKNRKGTLNTQSVNKANQRGTTEQNTILSYPIYKCPRLHLQINTVSEYYRCLLTSANQNKIGHLNPA